MTDGAERLGVAPVRSRPLPRYLVSAKHEVRLPTPGGYVFRPWGRWHARMLGRASTVCGLAAVDWTFFWELRVSDGGPNLCPECSAFLRIHQPKCMQ